MTALVERLQRWWANRPCYTQRFPYGVGLSGEGVTMTCAEADAYDRFELEMIQREHERAAALVTRPEYV